MNTPDYHFEVYPCLKHRGPSKWVLVAVADDDTLPAFNSISYRLITFYSQLDWAWEECDRRNRAIGYVKEGNPIRNGIKDSADLIFAVHPILQVGDETDKGGQQINKFIVLALQPNQSPWQDIGYKIVSWHNTESAGIAQAKKFDKEQQEAKAGNQQDETENATD